MQDIESHTIIYLRSLLATRAIDDPEVATFLACWLHEETFHGLALARFLEAAGYPVGRPTAGAQPRVPGASGSKPRLHRLAVARVARLLRRAHGLGRHQRADHPDRLPPARGRRRSIPCSPICSSASRAMRAGTSSSTIARPRAASATAGAWRGSTRAIVDRFWAPVGSGVQPRAELDFLGQYLFSGSEGRAAARKVDDTIRRLPGFASVKLLEAWIDR